MLATAMLLTVLVVASEMMLTALLRAPLLPLLRRLPWLARVPPYLLLWELLVLMLEVLGQMW
jgi:hypothetical protein